MPPVAAIAVPIIMSATVAGIATGALVVGTALTVASKITGSKLMGKIGMGLSLAGGVGGLAAGAAGIGGMTLGEIGGASAIGAGETAASSVLSAETLGIGNQAASAGSNAIGNTTKALGTLNKTKSAAQASDMFSPDSDSYKKFEMATNIIGGMAEGRDEEANRKQAMKMQNDEQAFQQKEIDRRAKNLNEFGAATTKVGSGIKRSSTPLLRMPQPLGQIA